MTSVGNAHPRVVEAVQQQVASFTHTCFTIAAYDGYVEVAEALNRLTPGDHESARPCSTPVPRPSRTP